MVTQRTESAPGERAPDAQGDDGNGHAYACCLCLGPLDVHQPDPDHPDRLLGTCGRCETWFLVEPGEVPQGLHSFVERN